MRELTLFWHEEVNVVDNRFTLEWFRFHVIVICTKECSKYNGFLQCRGLLVFVQVQTLWRRSNNTGLGKLSWIIAFQTLKLSLTWFPIFEIAYSPWAFFSSNRCAWPRFRCRSFPVLTGQETAYCTKVGNFEIVSVHTWRLKKRVFG